MAGKFVLSVLLFAGSLNTAYAGPLQDAAASGAQAAAPARTVVPGGCGDRTDGLNVACFGADATGVNDSSSAFQKAADSANGKAITIPPGTFLLRSPVRFTSTGNGPGPRLAGAGQDVTTLVPCFAQGGGSSVLTVEGAQAGGGPKPYQFAFGGYLRDFTISGERGKTPKAGGCGDASAVSGIAITSWWQGQIEGVEITGLGGDAISFPWRQDIFRVHGCGSPDCFASAHLEMKHLRLIRNGGWGINAGSGIAFTYNVITESLIEGNAAGGIRLAGWQNAIVGNSIAWNGCSTREGPPDGKCTSKEPGGGILAGRINPNPDQPTGYQSVLGLTIERNELDSNFGYHIWQEGGEDAQIVQNRFINHAPSVWMPGKGGNFPHCQVVLGFAPTEKRSVVRNTYLRQNISRSDNANNGASDFDVQMYCVDPAQVMQTEESQDTTFGTNSGNFKVLASGGGAAAVCSQQSGRVNECRVIAPGWYPPNYTPKATLQGPGCQGQALRVAMNNAPGQNAVESIAVENPGQGCSGQVWVNFEAPEFPAANALQNSFRGYQPVDPKVGRGRFTEFTRPTATPRPNP